MLAKTPVGNRFYNWVNSQDSNRRYEWHNNCGCACGRFLIEEMGLDRDEVQNALAAVTFPSMRTSRNADAVEVWSKFNQLAKGSCGTDWFNGYSKATWTFGKLAERIREKMPECVA